MPTCESLNETDSTVGNCHNLSINWCLNFFTEQDVKKKWTNLKDTFHQHRRTYEAALVSGAGAVEPPTWKFWTCFAWLLDVNRACKATTTSNIPAYNTSDEENSCLSEQQIPSLPKKLKRGGAKSTLEDGMRKIDQQIEQALKEPTDEAYMYAMSLPEKFRRLTPYQFAFCRKEIEALLFKCEFEVQPPAMTRATTNDHDYTM